MPSNRPKRTPSITIVFQYLLMTVFVPLLSIFMLYTVHTYPCIHNLHTKLHTLIGKNVVLTYVQTVRNVRMYTFNRIYAHTRERRATRADTHVSLEAAVNIPRKTAPRLRAAATTGAAAAVVGGSNGGVSGGDNGRVGARRASPRPQPFITALALPAPLTSY